MLTYKQAPLSLALWEKIKYGQDIGLDTSRDKICPHCWNGDNYTRVVSVNGSWRCPTHGFLSEVAPEYVIEENPIYRGFYESKLVERLRTMKALVPTTTTPHLVKQDELLRMKAIVRARVGITDFGEHTENVINMIAYGALVHGLNPITGEIFPYVEKSEGKITKISLEVDYRGLQRSARMQADYHIDIEHKRVLSVEEIRERKLHITPNWAYYKDKTKPPFIEHDPNSCIAVEVDLYRLDLYEKLLTMAERAIKMVSSLFQFLQLL